MALTVKEVFPTMQGEGSLTGAPAVFVRLAGCNLWSGLQHLRYAGSGVCAAWCDTDFAKGTKYDPLQIVDTVLAHTAGWRKPLVVVSGGEPCLQLRTHDGERFVSLMQDAGLLVAVETNGTVEADVLASLYHVTVSPKALRDKGEDALSHVLVRNGTDLKVVAPQWSVDDMRRMSEWAFSHRFVQPLDESGGGGDVHPAVSLAARLGWRVSIQTHKLVNLP